MTTISSRVICDSVSPQGVRLTTMLLKYPRVIHSEFMTHRDFSRNASSSRAVPVTKIIEDIMRDPYVPIHWGKNQKGMQADEQCEELVHIDKLLDCHIPKGVTSEYAWLKARDAAVEVAKGFHRAGYHKQIVNRLLEPFSHISVVVSSTRWANFFALRDHEDAMPEIRRLAERIKMVMDNSLPITLKPGEWHVPFLQKGDWDVCATLNPENVYEPAIKMSVARCARVSYLTTEGKLPEWSADLALYNRLVGERPLHATPTEHQATPDEVHYQDHGGKWFHYRNEEKHGNFDGWVQYRKLLKDEYVYDAHRRWKIEA